MAPKLQPSTSTYNELFTEFSDKYENNTSASALLWWWLDNDANFGLRVEAPAIMKEFTNGKQLGRDPQGTLFFHNVADFKDGVDIKYDIYYNEGAKITDNQHAFVIQFYNETADRSYANFLAKNYEPVNPQNQVKRVLQGLTGKWQPLTSASAAAHVKKETSVDVNWTVTVPSVNLQAKFSIENDASAKAIEVSVDTWGMLTFKQINDIRKGKFVDYRDGRIFFTETKEQSRDYCSFFIATETFQDEDPLGKYALRCIPTTWSSI